MSWFRGFGMRHLAVALAFSVAVPLTGALFKSAVGYMPMHGALQLPHLFGEAVSCFLAALCAMLSMVAAENRLVMLGLAARMVIAVLAAAITATALMEAGGALSRSLGLPLEDMAAAALYVGDLHRVAFHFAGMASWTLVFVALYVMFEASRRASAALHSARVAALAAERDLVEGDLRATQARVEPDLLFAALLAVDRAYVRSVRSGEQALDALIGFLRAALPAQASGTATLAAEVDLVKAYLGVVELLSAPKLELEIAVEPAAQGVSMPAMLLLPLVRWALGGRSTGRLQLTARHRDGALAFSIGSDSKESAQSAESEISGVRGRLSHLYGSRAVLELSIAGSLRQAVVNVPSADVGNVSGASLGLL